MSTVERLQPELSLIQSFVSRRDRSTISQVITFVPSGMRPFVVPADWTSYHERSASLPDGCGPLTARLLSQTPEAKVGKGSHETDVYLDISALCNLNRCICICHDHSGGCAASGSDNRKSQQRQCKGWAGVPRDFGSAHHCKWPHCLSQRFAGYWKGRGRTSFGAAQRSRSLGSQIVIGQRRSVLLSAEYTSVPHQRRVAY